MLTPKLSKQHNELLHYVSTVEMVRKHTWIISFGVWMKKTAFGGLIEPKLARPDLVILQIPQI
jgi:hypothetical protein